MILFLIDSLITADGLFGLAGEPAYIRDVAAAICAGWARQDRAQVRHGDVDMDQSWRSWKTSTSRLNRTGRTACHWPPSRWYRPRSPARENRRRARNRHCRFGDGLRLAHADRHAGPGGKPRQRGGDRGLQGPFRPRRRLIRAGSVRPLMDGTTPCRGEQSRRCVRIQRAERSLDRRGRAERRDAKDPRVGDAMSPLLREIRHTPLLWLLAFVPVLLVAHKLRPEAHTLHFVLSVLAIVPLAALLSHATESVAAKTGDAVGGLLNATLGNLTELRHRADRIARRATYPGEGIHRRGDRHQYPVHVGDFVFPRRPQAPRAGVQQGQRPPASGPALSGRRRDPDSVGGLGSRFRGGVGVHGNIERLSVRPAHRRLRTGPVCSRSRPIANSSVARTTRRPAKHRGR